MADADERTPRVLRNIPIRTEGGRELREAFVNRLFIEVDYSQIELRILAHMKASEREEAHGGSGESDD